MEKDPPSAILRSKRSPLVRKIVAGQPSSNVSLSLFSPPSRGTKTKLLATRSNILDIFLFLLNQEKVMLRKWGTVKI